MKRQATRELFQVNFKLKPGGRNLVLVGNHWPSRSGGELESEAYRIMAGETLSYWLERIEEAKGKNTPVLLMGDFNDEPHDRSMTEYLLGTQSARKVLGARNPRLLNLMWPLMGRGLGTHYFDGAPATLDQFLVSRGFLNGDGGLGVKADSVQIEGTSTMAKAEDGSPVRFGRPSAGMNPNGFSDHFPISVALTSP